MNPPGTLMALAAAACIGAGILSARAEITIGLVNVGNAGNPADQAYGTNRPFGAVAYDFAIGTYEVTNTQYAAFLNAVAVTDTYALYPATIKYPLTRGIVQSGTPGAYSYSIVENMADKPANNMTWFSAARFANWLANGQPVGLQTGTTTEDGAYSLNGAMSGGFSITRNAVNPNTSAMPSFWMPSEDEWYKAAFYQPETSPGGPAGSYWLYPTRSNTAPAVASADTIGNISNPGENVANYLSGSSWNGQFENVTTVGSAGELSASFYGTSDQAGNVWEWSEGIVKDGTARGLRQGSANDPSALYLAADFGNNGRPPDTYYWNAGFRIAAIPEPSAAGLILLASGAGCLAWIAAKKRNQPSRQNPRVRKEMRENRIADLPITRGRARLRPSRDNKWAHTEVRPPIAGVTRGPGSFLAKHASKAAMLCLAAMLMTFGRAVSAEEPKPLADAINASERGDSGWLSDWITKGGNPDQADGRGWTPLLVAAARGHSAAVDVLLNNPVRKADPGMRFVPSGALPIHMAGQSGDVETAQVLLAVRPADINEVWLLNGHTLLLQAAFYGHLDLAKFALQQGANPAATTVRGLTALDFARQFDNQPLVEILDASAPTPEAKAAYYKALLDKIREPVPPGEAEAQSRSDKAATTIAESLGKAGNAPETVPALEEAVASMLEGTDVNRLAGDLRQPLLVVTVTGNNAGTHPEAAADLRLRLARMLIDRGADPLAREKHPMGAISIIRASVFGHLDILKLMGSRITAAELAGALNEIPSVNGLTALHDAVLRARTAPEDRLPGYLEQIRWEASCGARSDIGDFSGRTQRQYAEEIPDASRRQAVLAALDLALPVPQWNHPAIAVPVLEPAVQWYSDVFGFVPITAPIVHTPASGERWKIATSIFGEDISEVRFLRMRAPGAPFQQVIEIFEIHPTPPPPEPGKRKSGYVHACLIVGDVSMTADRIAARGGKILSRAALNGVQIIFCEDPYGNIIELASAPW